MPGKERDPGSLDSRTIEPLYKRLRPGPHGMAREDVESHQRHRIQGALIEAVARHGYPNTTIRHIIAYAATGRRIFYEIFKNKEDCFLATWDLIVQRLAHLIAHACDSVEDPKQRQQLAMRVLANELEANPNALRLLLVDSLTAGPSANHRLSRLLSDAEHRLASPAAPWIIGGIYRVLFGRLRNERLESKLHQHILDWAQPLTTKEIHKPRAGQGRAPPWPQTPKLPLTGQSVRARLEESAINMMLRDGELGPLTIATRANVSLEAYLSIFHDVDECLHAALQTPAGQLLAIIADPELFSDTQPTADTWPTAVHDAISRATAYLATNPAYTTLLASKVYELIVPTERMLLLCDEIATLLTEGAPNPPTKLTTELISGALARTLTIEVQAKHGHQLQDLNTALSQIVLSSLQPPNK